MSKNKFRLSQTVTTYGPGSMVDLPDASIIVAGLDDWSYDVSAIPVVEEPRLVDKLKTLLEKQTLTLRTPPPATDDHRRTPTRITGFKFPEWFVVQKSVIGPQGFRKRRLVNLSSLDNGCYMDEDRKRQPVVPVRFVRACPSGHIGDIDWSSFVHGSGVRCVRDLWLEERGTSGDMSDIWIL